MSNRAMVIGERIRQLISTAICFEMGDPDLAGVIITRVKVSPDYQFADIRFTYPEEECGAETVVRALNRAKGAIKRVLASQIKLRKVPELRFHPDEDVRAERRIGKILEDLDIPPKEDDEA